MELQTRRRTTPTARRTGSAGQALAEFAIILVVLLLLVLGVVDLSRAVYLRSMVANAAREGARYAIVHPRVSQEEYTSGIEAAVKGLAVGVPASDLGIQVVPEQPLSDTVEVDVEVVVTCTFHPTTILIARAAGVGPDGITLVGRAKMRREPSS